MRMDRRDVLRIIGAGAAAGSLAGCDVFVPRSITRARRRGVDRRVVTTCGACPAACGIDVRTVGHDAVQIRGVPGHPVSDGGVCPRGIAEIQNLYHPERLRGPLRRTGIRLSATDWPDALASAGAGLRRVPALIGVGGLGALEELAVEWLASKLGASLARIEFPWASPPRRGFGCILGSDDWTYDLAHADLVLSLGSDFLQSSPSPVEAQRAYRALRERQQRRGRLITVSPHRSITAARSDEWIAAPPGSLARLGMSIAHLLARERSRRNAVGAEIVSILQDNAFAPEKIAQEIGIEATRIQNLAERVAVNGVVITDASDPTLEIVGVLLNLIAGAVGRPGGLLRRAVQPLPISMVPSRRPGDFDLVREIADVGAVLLVGANPLFASLHAMQWGRVLERALFSASVTTFLDESAERCDLVLAASTPLEAPRLAWGSTADGTPYVTAGPAAVPRLYDTRDMTDVVLAIGHACGIDLPWPDGSAMRRDVARELGADRFLESGGALRSTPPARAPVNPSTALRTVVDQLAQLHGSVSEPPQEYPLVLHLVSPLAFPSGEGAHLPYLHGLPTSCGREIWRTMVEIHPDAARSAGISDGGPVIVESRHGVISAVARVRSGVHPSAVAIPFGLGRRSLGRFARGHGSNPLDLFGDEPTTFVRLRRT